MSEDYISLDLETRSTVNLKTSGAYRYWRDPTTGLWCACYAIGDGPVQRWIPGMDVPDDVVHGLKQGMRVSAWNTSFERLGWWNRLAPDYGWPELDLERFEDTAAWAAAMALPRGLDKAAEVMGMPVQKDLVGKKLMQRMMVPRKAREGEDPKAIHWNDSEEDLERLIQYCETDVAVERDLRKVLMPLREQERQYYFMDQRMNDRGLQVDMDLVGALKDLTANQKVKLNEKMSALTGGAVTACTQVKQIIAYLAEQGVKMESLAKDKVADALEWDIPPDTRGVLELRKEASKTSTSKLNAFEIVVGPDGKVRGMHLYHGAATGRWTGRLVQVQNFPRGKVIVKDAEAAVTHILDADVDMIEFMYGDPMTVASDMLRACIKASDGCRLMVADYSAVEGRVTAWVAGDDNELEAYRLADRKEGPGIYEIAAGSIFNVDPRSIDKEGDFRQVGKVAVLALGFGGGVMAFHGFAVIYGVDMADAYEPLIENSSEEDVERAEKRYRECKADARDGADLLSREAWIASELTKVLWRRAHPEVVDLWAGVEEAAIKAVKEPGSIQTYRSISYTFQRGFLFCRLPSGRCLAYASPAVKPKMMPWGKAQPALSYWGVSSQKGGAWVEQDLYGGRLAQNVIQAVARDLMAHGMLTAEQAGYPIVMTVHDEAAADVPNDFGTLAEYEAHLCSLPDWAAGLPLVAEGYEAQRYRK